MSRAHRPTNRMAIALVAILVIAFGIYLIFTKRIPFVHGTRINAVFQSSNQLVPGFSPVRTAGVDIGKVTKVTNGPGDTTIVTMELDDSGLPVRKDARARIRPRLFLEGGFAIELSPGSPSAPELEDGDTLPRSQTAQPVQLHQILTAFNRPTRENLRSFLKEFDTSFDKGAANALGKAFKPLAPVLRDGAQIAEAARGVREHDASDGIINTAKITSKLAENREQLAGLIVSLNRTTTALASRDVQLARGIREIDLLARDAPANLDRIDAALPTVRRFVEELRPSLRELDPVLTNAAPVLTQLQGLMGPAEAPRLIRDLKPTVDGLEPLTRGLLDLFPLVKPVTECVRDNAIPTLTSEVPDGALSTGDPAWQDLAHALVGLASANQNFDANGYAIRYQAGAGETSIGTGSVPGLGALTGLAAEEITGSTPRWLGPGVTPPLRPDVPCAESEPPNLANRTEQGPLPGTARKVDFKKPDPMSMKQLRGLIGRYNDALGGLKP